MKANFKLSCAIAAAMMLYASTGSAQEAASGASRLKATLSATERGRMAGQFVRKWGTYASQTYGLDVRSWSQRMVPTFVHADPINFQRALLRSTYEGAMATLDGRGEKVSDDKVIDALAQSSEPTVTPAALGELTRDLVFTSITPCRIIDTRGMAAGAIAAGTSRGFYVWGFANYTSQGGASTDCGLGGQSPEAIVVNVTAVAPSQTGYATVYPANASQPLAASMIYQAGQVMSNAVTVKLGTVGNNDIQIFSEKAAHYVVDIVGYYDAPYATPLDCIDTGNTIVSVAAGATTNVTAPACASGYTQTATNCESGSWQMPFVYQHNGFCSAQNNGASAAELRASRTCCRVPGR